MDNIYFSPPSDFPANHKAFDLEKGRGPTSHRVNRGGSWNNNPRNMRASNRNKNEPTNRNNNLGVRCSREGRPSMETCSRHRPESHDALLWESAAAVLALFLGRYVRNQGTMPGRRSQYPRLRQVGREGVIILPVRTWRPGACSQFSLFGHRRERDGRVAG